ncbi:uncharacterized protein LOC128555435 [Mercenaria mercenaria]|uniref:uncharacterized protein LOC128555435 n=1 Tax=Mercenaria mercenaria TaxID=6596 RepID=UPI00234E65EC|nr:uncharacterized protein LOC128555435 [Mercenaria mercenaria]
MDQRSNLKTASLCQENNFTQLIQEPTHFTENSSSILDLFFVSNPRSVVASGVSDHFLEQELRYHCPTYCILKFCKPKPITFTRLIWMYDQCNFDLLRQSLSSADWESCSNADVNAYASNITDTILSICKNLIPNKTVTVRPRDVPWMTSAIRRCIRRRKRAYKKAKLSGSVEHWSKFRRIRNDTIRSIKQAKSTYYINLVDKLKTCTSSSKDWWNTLKPFITKDSSVSIPPLIDPVTNMPTTSDAEKADLLNTYFANQTQLNDDGKIPPNPTVPPVERQLSSVTLIQNEVEDVLRNLQIGKASGPDGISNRILREASRQLSGPLCSLFNYSLHSANVPLSWKDANVCAVFKKGDSSLPNNYRPISLLSCVEKAFEKVLFKHTYNHLHDTNFLTRCSLVSYLATPLSVS